MEIRIGSDAHFAFATNIYQAIEVRNSKCSKIEIDIELLIQDRREVETDLQRSSVGCKRYGNAQRSLHGRLQLHQRLDGLLL